MMKKCILFCFLLGILGTQYQQSLAQAPQSQIGDKKMEWWKDAKFGMFIHWGLYSVPAGTYKGKKIPWIGEWIMSKAKIPVAEYVNYAKQFNPTKFDANEWVKMAKDAGMKYIVLTSKHHEGFAMFKSKDSFNIVDATPFKRDVVKELAEACKKHQMKLGLYYSQCQDWTAPGGLSYTGHWDSAQNGDLNTYIYNKVIPQIKEILTNYGDIAVLWFDTPNGMKKEHADKIMEIIKMHPNLIYNNRLGGGYGGDLETPEQYIPATGFPNKNWESCMTMNDTWGYKSDDNNWKSNKRLIHNLIDVASKGGNYLLNVGPTSEGIIPQPSVDRLKTIGNWLKINGEAIYGVKASPFTYLSFGRCTVKKDSLYLHVFNWPSNGIIKVPMQNKINHACLLADKKTTIKYKQTGKYIKFFLPKKCIDTFATVIALQLNEKPNVTVLDPIPSMNKPATASSQKNDSYSPSSVFNVNAKKGWIAADNEKTGWIAIDLGKPTSIGSITITEAGEYDHFIQKFRLEYKDNDEWKTVYEGTTIGPGYSNRFKPIIAQTFRINILESTKTPQIKEMQLYFDEE